jgi:phosphinothricin acetyltransferase
MLLDIYNHYIINTPTSFDIEPRTPEQQKAWFAQFARTGPYRCFVAVRGTRVLGFSSSYGFKERAAYHTSVTTSVFLLPEETGKGLGRRLYGALFAALAGGPHRAYAAITLPNDASVALHHAFGFKLIGVQNEVGKKSDRFWDVALYQKAV